VLPRATNDGAAVALLANASANATIAASSQLPLPKIWYIARPLNHTAFTQVAVPPPSATASLPVP
jgi:hypothetical protein